MILNQTISLGRDQAGRTSPALLAAAGSAAAAAVLIGLLLWGRERIGSREPPLLFYCAAGIKPPVEAVARQYEQAYGQPVQLQYGGSGALLSNLRAAHRGDLYLAADETHIQLAREHGLVAAVVAVARLRPAIAVRKGNPKQIRSVEDLLRPDVRVGLAQPETTAVGQITRELLRKTGQWAALEQHARVFKPTLPDVANDLKLGSLDATVVWDATVRQYAELERVPVRLFDEAVQTIRVAVLRCSERPAAALRFAHYLAASDRGLKEFARHGYEPVPGEPWSESGDR